MKTFFKICFGVVAFLFKALFAFVGIIAYVVCAVIIPEEPEDYVTVTEN